MTQNEMKTQNPRTLFVVGLIVGVFFGFLLSGDTAKISLWNVRASLRNHELAVQEHELAVREREQRCGPAMQPIVLGPDRRPGSAIKSSIPPSP